MKAPAYSLPAVLVAGAVVALASPWGEKAREDLRFEAMMFEWAVEHRGGPVAVRELLFGYYSPGFEYDARTRSPEQLLAGIVTPRPKPGEEGLIGCGTGYREFEPDVEAKLEELKRRGPAARPALVKALSSGDAVRSQVALRVLLDSKFDASEAVRALEDLLPDARLGRDAALLLWRSGAEGRLRVSEAAFYPPPLPEADFTKLPRGSPEHKKALEAFELWKSRKDNAQTPFYRDPDGAFDILKAVLTSPREGDRSFATYRLGDLKTRRPEGVELVIELLGRERDPLLVGALIDSLRNMGPAAVAAGPQLKSLAQSPRLSSRATWALFAVTGEAAYYERMLAEVESKGTLPVSDLRAFASGCERFPKARAAMEKAFLNEAYLDSYEESVWTEGLRGCMGPAWTDDDLRALDGRRKTLARAGRDARP